MYQTYWNINNFLNLFSHKSRGNCLRPGIFQSHKSMTLAYPSCLQQSNALKLRIKPLMTSRLMTGYAHPPKSPVVSTCRHQYKPSMVSCDILWTQLLFIPSLLVVCLRFGVILMILMPERYERLWWVLLATFFHSESTGIALSTLLACLRSLHRLCLVCGVQCTYYVQGSHLWCVWIQRDCQRSSLKNPSSPSYALYIFNFSNALCFIASFSILGYRQRSWPNSNLGYWSDCRISLMSFSLPGQRQWKNSNCQSMKCRYAMCAKKKCLSLMSFHQALQWILGKNIIRSLMHPDNLRGQRQGPGQMKHPHAGPNSGTPTQTVCFYNNQMNKMNKMNKIQAHPSKQFLHWFDTDHSWDLVWSGALPTSCVISAEVSSATAMKSDAQSACQSCRGNMET